MLEQKLKLKKPNLKLKKKKAKNKAWIYLMILKSTLLNLNLKLNRLKKRKKLSQRKFQTNRSIKLIKTLFKKLLHGNIHQWIYWKMKVAKFKSKIQNFVKKQMKSEENLNSLISKLECKTFT